MKWPATCLPPFVRVPVGSSALLDVPPMPRIILLPRLTSSRLFSYLWIGLCPWTFCSHECAHLMTFSQKIFAVCSAGSERIPSLQGQRSWLIRSKKGLGCRWMDTSTEKQSQSDTYSASPNLSLSSRKTLHNWWILCSAPANRMRSWLC